MSRNLILGLVGLAVVALAAWLIFSVQPKAVPSNSTPATSSSTTSETKVTPTPVVTIHFTGSAFNPTSTTVKSGDTVAFKNDSSQTIQVQSNPHPLHTDNTELNIGTIPPGETMTATLTKVGTWGYHNHLNPGQGGTITVQ